MTRLAVVVSILASSALIVLGVAGAQRDQSRPELIRITASTADVSATDSLRADVLYLWNRNITSRPIGHAVISCRDVGSGGLLGSGLFTCSANFVLPLGKIAATGIVHSFRRYTLVVTGGTRRYLGAAGTVFVRRDGPGDLSIVVTL